MEKFNLIVIGGGSAGLMTAAGAAGLGARVALIEQGKMGGDCLNYGCVPSKALLRCAKEAAARRAGRFGFPAGEPEVDWAGVSRWVQGAIADIAPHDSVERFQTLGVEVVAGRGRLASRKAVEVEMTGGGALTLQGRSVVVATGSSPAVPPVPGLAEAGYLTNETVFDLPSLPGRMLVMGGGPIGVELAQAFARLGSQVTLVEMLPRILSREDADAAAVVAQSLEADGVRVLTGQQVVRMEPGEVGGEKRVVCKAVQETESSGGEDGSSSRGENSSEAFPEETIPVDQILVAVGRRPNLDGLGLEEAGVVLKDGHIKVDSFMRTSAMSVYACGDVAGPYAFTHMAGQQARVVIQNSLLPFKARMDYRVVPWCTFTDPELARVGLSEEEAAAEGKAVRVIKVPFEGIDRAVCDGAREGFLKILTPPKRDVILGATLVGAHAGELLHEVVLAMQARLRLRDLAKTVHIYPTLAEIFRRAGDEARKESFTPTMQRLFKAYLGWRCG